MNCTRDYAHYLELRILERGFFSTIVPGYVVPPQCVEYFNKNLCLKYDVDGSGIVDDTDRTLVLMAQSTGSNETLLPLIKKGYIFDVNVDGRVNSVDASFVIENQGETY